MENAHLMMNRPVRSTFPFLAVAAILAAATPTTIPAQGPTALEFDPAQTKVEWTLAGNLHTVHGTFALKRGTITFDAAAGKASGELVVDAASGQSGSDGRDKNMHQHVIESSKYTEIVFRPDRIEGKVAPQGSSHVQLHGVFLMHGAEHEMMVPVMVTLDGGRYSAVANFTIPYVQWGMKNPSKLMLRVNDKVDVTVQGTLSTR
jgi:polyisoprenoid-binding protein YceI